MLKTVEEITTTSTKVDFTTIDMSAIKAITAKKSRPQFASLLKTAMDIDSGHLGVVRHAKDETREPVPKKKTMKDRKNTPAKAPQDNASGTLGNEVKGFADAMDKKANQQQGVKAPLPNNKMSIELSRMAIPDQIREIGRILEGLNSNTFDKGQIKKIKKEATVLSKQAAKDAKKRAKSKQPNADEGLVTLRNQQLGELVKVLSGIK